MDRQEALDKAIDISNVLVEQHGLVVLSSGSAFAPSHKVSPAEQHLDLIIRLADWFLEKDSDILEDDLDADECPLKVTDDTLHKIHRVLEESGMLSIDISNVINQLHYEGIVFVERV